MLKRYARYSLALVLTIGCIWTLSVADQKHDHRGRHGHHGDQKGHHGDRNGHDGEHSHVHRHAEWETPPLEYANRRSDRWTDDAAIARGEKLFETNCVVCHGSDGRGTGPAAKTLPHAPADLTHHFHMKPGDGDAYLFWRVSEGGTVEPFKSMKSTMPAFKTVLSEDQRWDVLAYVHDQFHQDFKLETMPKSVTGKGIIVAVVPAREQVVVDHQEIEGFMAAMTMGYKVHPTSLLDRISAGDQVRFTIDTQQNAIIKIEKMKE